MRKLVKRWSCIALCTSLVLTGSFVMPFQSSKVLAAEQQTGVVSSENLLKNPELNPNTANGNEPHWWYGNNGAKVTTVTGTDQDGNNQYVEVSNRSLYYSAMAQNITDVLTAGNDGDIYEMSVWFKLASNATSDSMNLKVGNNITYTDGTKSYDRWFTKERIVTANKEQWVQVQTSLQISELDKVKSVELVFYSKDGEQPSSFYVDGVSLTREEKESLPIPSTTNLFKNPELNPDTANGNKPHWWYGNNDAKVVTVTGGDQDGNNQYVKVSNRSKYYSAMALNITDVIQKYGDKAVYNVSTWFKLASDANVDTMSLKIGLNTTYKNGSVKHDYGFMDDNRIVTANKESWVQAKSSFEVTSLSEISNVEVVFYSDKEETPSSFYVDGVVLNLIKCPNPPTTAPTVEPTTAPTVEPTTEPTVEPTTEVSSTIAPTIEPTVVPTVEPTIEPTVTPIVEPTVEQKQKNPLVVNKTSYTKTKGAKKFWLTGIKGKGTITYKSLNKKVATVNKKGYVVVKGYGKAVITVKAAGNNTYNSATKKIIIYVVPKKPTASVKVATKKQIKVSWKKDKSATGYQVKVATNRKFKSARTYKVSSKKSSYTVKKLTSKKTYYIKVRTSKKVGKNIVYSAWSSVKVAKAK